MTVKAAARWLQAADYWRKAAAEEANGNESLARQYRDYAREQEARGQAEEANDAG